jgi:hypothetical protein
MAREVATLAVLSVASRRAAAFVMQNVAERVGECAYERVIRVVGRAPLAARALLGTMPVRPSLFGALRHVRHVRPLR